MAYYYPSFDELTLVDLHKGTGSEQNWAIFLDNHLPIDKKTGKRDESCLDSLAITKNGLWKNKQKITPTKWIMLELCVILKLNKEESIRFLALGGYAFAPCSKYDSVFILAINEGKSIDEVHSFLKKNQISEDE